MKNKPLALRWALVGVGLVIGVAGINHVRLWGASPEQPRLVRASLAAQAVEVRTLPLPGLMGSPGKPVLDGNVTVDKNYCAANAFELPGQAWRVDFSTGGIIPNFRNLTTGQIKEPSFKAIFGMQAPADLKAEVALIVADHFGSTEIKVSPNAPATVPLGSEQTFNLSHGALVTSHIRMLLEEAGYKMNSASRLTAVFTRGKEPNQHTIKLYGVDIQGQLNNTQEIVNRLNNLINEISTDIVLNMSFSIIPCKILQRYRDLAPIFEKATRSRYTFRAFIDDEVKLQGGDPKEAQIKLLQEPPNDEPLTQWLSATRREGLRGGGRFIAVASSGNYGLSISTLPAAWPSVISVGATNWDGKDPGLPARGVEKPEGNWSDKGNISSAGEWFKLDASKLDIQCRRNGNLFCVQQSPKPLKSLAPNFGYRGTSFSAPSVAAMIAWQISGDSGKPNSCFPNSGLASGWKIVKDAEKEKVKNSYFYSKKPC